MEGTSDSISTIRALRRKDKDLEKYCQEVVRDAYTNAKTVDTIAKVLQRFIQDPYPSEEYVKIMNKTFCWEHKFCSGRFFTLADLQDHVGTSSAKITPPISQAQFSEKSFPRLNGWSALTATVGELFAHRYGVTTVMNPQLNQILYIANKWYKDLTKNQDPIALQSSFLTPGNHKYVFRWPDLNINVEISFETGNDLCGRIGERNIIGSEEGQNPLEVFLDSDSPYAILTINGHSVGLIRSNEKLYTFHPQAMSDNGQIAKVGRACLKVFPEDSIESIYWDLYINYVNNKLHTNPNNDNSPTSEQVDGQGDCEYKITIVRMDPLSLNSSN